MPIQIDTSVKGREYAPFTVTVERGKIKEFARGDWHEVDVELWAENQKGEKVVTGRATVTVPSRG